MLRRSKKDTRDPQNCTCLLEAYRKFPAVAEASKGCASPNCPVRSLDDTTLHQFLEAIGGPEGAGNEAAGAGNEIPIFRAVARRRKRRKSRRLPD